jgi:F-type H+-transporting ATPase subunit c
MGALEVFIACATAAGFGIAIAAFGCGIAQGIGLKSAVEGIARNPESSGKVTVTLLIGLAMIESLCIYALVIALMLLMKTPGVDQLVELLQH